MSLTTVAGSTLRQQHVKAQQKGTKSPQTVVTNNNITVENSTQVIVNTLQHTSPPSSSTKTSLSTSPIASNYMGSASLFSFDNGVTSSGSSGCCSLSNSPSSSSASSNSFMPLHSLENSCNKISSGSANQMSLEDSFTSASCQLNASLLAAVNGDLEEDHVVTKSSSDGSQNETNQHISDSMHIHRQNEKNLNAQRILLDNIQHHHQHAQKQTNSDSSCLNNEEARTLQLAVELSMMNLNQIPSPTSVAATSSSLLPSSNHQNYQQLQSHNLEPGCLDHHDSYSSSATQYSPAVGNPYHMTTKVFLQAQSQAAATLFNQKIISDSNQDNIPAKLNSLHNPNQNLNAAVPTTTDERSKKSQNMTECVPVPSSEHVAEIVGRQGCKIKALRAKTNTYIKTPVRNEEPVFVVTGRKEDVAKAKREILSAAEHFTLIRATRRTNDGSSGILSGGNGGSVSGAGGCGTVLSLNKNLLSTTTPIPGQITIQVRVPYRVVGLVVGPKGNTIKHIQHETQTYIVTPSRDKEPIFEVTGMPDNVQMARKQIEAHIATRTGNALAVPAPPPPPPPPPAPAGTLNRLCENLNSNTNSSSFHSINSLNQMLNDDLHSEILSSIYKNGIGSALEYSQLGSNLLNTNNKSNNSSILYNGFANNDMNSAGMMSINDIQRRVTLNSGNMQLNCNDFINIIDTNSNSSTSTQFVSEQHTTFPQTTNNTNIKSVINTMNLLENSNSGNGTHSEMQNHQLVNINSNNLLTRSSSSASSTASSSKSLNNNVNNNNIQFWKSLNVGTSLAATATNNGINSGKNDNIDIDEGIGESPLYSWGLTNNTLATLTNSYCSPTSTSISPTDSLFGEHNKTTTVIQQQTDLKSLSKLKLEKFKRRNCWMCHEKDIVTALVPCGHTIFCSLCANRLCQQNDAICPVCSVQIYQAIRVH